MRVLFVINPLSIHVKRWLSQLKDTGWDLHAAPYYSEIPNEDFLWPLLQNKAHTLQRHRHVNFAPMPPPHTRPSWARELARKIDELKPDIIHSFNLQETGYLVRDALELSRWRGPWIVTSQGNDVNLFGRLSAHKSKIRSVLERADYYWGECERDGPQARAFGFRGDILPLIPSCGGFDVALCSRYRERERPSRRKWILLKGYDNYSGRALAGLKAIELCRNELEGFTIGVYSSYPSVKAALQRLREKTGLRIKPLGRASFQRQMIRHAGARVSISLAISDGVCVSALEAMAMGSFPIQSDSSCLAEWITSGRSGALVPAEDPRAIARALRQALRDDRMVEAAAKINFETIKAKMDSRAVREMVIGTYLRIHHSRAEASTRPKSAPKKIASRAPKARRPSPTKTKHGASAEPGS
ncbi:MAG TPA: glycosyltransferase [Bdellovibrionales bacterium]|nr:glycosyltransferase [Bdellovibrionales bacterium]